MFFSNSSFDDVVWSILPSSSKIKNRIERSKNEVDLVVQSENEIKKLKIFNVSEVKEKRILEFLEIQSLLSECSLPFIYPSKIHQMSSNVLIYERLYYCYDLKSIIYTKCLSLSEISSIMIQLSEILMILCECDICVSNVKSSNIIYENNKMKLVDLCLNELRREEDIVIDEICYRSPEELSGSEYNDKSVIWSIGCILYEMLNKKIPFKEENDYRMIELMFRMLEVENEDRLSLLEFNKEMIRENEILRDSENNMMIIEERKEILFRNDYKTYKTFQIIYPNEYYLESERWEEIRDGIIEKYNNKPNERILSILVMMYLYKIDYLIEDKLKFQNHHQCKYGKEECYLDKMIFNVDNGRDDKERIEINSKCVCFCEEGMNYFFRILKLINPTNLSFDHINIPIHNQPLFGLCFSQVSNLQELDLLGCNLTFHFIESFVKSIPLMKKLKYVDLHSNPIGLTGLKLLLQYLHLLINNKNELNLSGMRLNDELILLSSELYKYPNLEKIDITYNKNIHSDGLKSLFSKFPISKIEFDFNRNNKELLIDKDIPDIVNYIYGLNLNNSAIDDEFFKSFISLRLNELKEIQWLDLSSIIQYFSINLDNKLTSKSIEILINNLFSLPKLKEIQLSRNPIGDVGMKILSPYIHLLKDWNGINCSKMGLSSEGMKYLLDRLKNINEKWIKLDISENNINFSGIEYLMNYMKENDNIEKFLIYNNPIGNNGFKLLLDNLDLLIEYCEMNLSNISIDDESVILLTNELDSIEGYEAINLSGNNIKMKGLKSICEKSLKNVFYPFIEMKSSIWTNEELEYYLDYCIKKKRSEDYSEYDFSNMNLNDSHISLIKQIDYEELDLSNNKISSKGLKELTDSLPKYSNRYISIFGNEIGDEGVEIICKYFENFVERDDDNNNPISLNLSNIGMSEKGLKMLIERLKKYKRLRKLDISGNELNEEELRLMKENKEVFDYLEELSISIKENINNNELRSFLETFSTIETIKLNGINEEEKKELSKEFFNIE